MGEATIKEERQRHEWRKEIQKPWGILRNRASLTHQFTISNAQVLSVQKGRPKGRRMQGLSYSHKTGKKMGEKVGLPLREGHLLCNRMTRSQD